jgi:hypothetical protein
LLFESEPSGNCRIGAMIKCRGGLLPLSACRRWDWEDEDEDLFEIFPLRKMGAWENSAVTSAVLLAGRPV